MKHLTIAETKLIAAGTILNLAGHTYLVDTTGIPDQCTSILGTLTQVSYQAQSNGLTPSQYDAVLEPYFDTLFSSGCNAYMEQYQSRLATCVLIG